MPIEPSATDTGSKYIRWIRPRQPGVHPDIPIDVYNVIDAYNVTCPAIGHAIKKLLCAGIRGAKDFDEDLAEAVDAINRARVLNHQRTEGNPIKGEPEVEECIVKRYDELINADVYVQELNPSSYMWTNHISHAKTFKSADEAKTYMDTTHSMGGGIFQGTYQIIRKV